MKFLNTIKFYAKRLGLNKVAVIAALGLLVAVPAAMTVAEYYPARTPFDYNKPCNPNDDDIYDRCGSLTGPVFNSFVNTPSYGDERAFVDARRTDQTAAGSYKDVLDNVTDGSKEVIIRMYVHNNANQNTNADGTGIAENTRVRVFLPSGTSDSLRARGYISANNAASVEDTVDFVDDKNFRIEYIPGSATISDGNNFNGGVKISDDIIVSANEVGDKNKGALIGSDALDGKFKGCFEDEAIVQIRVRIIPQETKTKFTKQVATATSGGWKERSTVAPGDKVAWLVDFGNEGSTELTNVNINDKLPPHLSVTPGSVKWTYRDKDGTDKTVTLDDKQFFTTGGYNFGDWSTGGGLYVRFDTTALGDFDGCQISIRNVARLNTDQTNQKEDVADVTIKKDNCEEPEVSFACNSIEILKVNRTSFNVEVNATASNTKIQSYTVNVKTPEGTEKGATSENKVVGPFTFTKPGTYDVSATVKTDAGTTKPSQKCSGTFTVEEEPEVPTYTCDLLDFEKVSDKKYSFTLFTEQSGGAELKHVNYDFGDGKKVLSTETTVEHTYKKTGTYVVTAVPTFTVDGQEVQAEDDDCKVTVRISDKPEEETPPTELPDTGPAEAAGVFSLVSLGGGLAHRFLGRRRG